MDLNVPLLSIIKYFSYVRWIQLLKSRVDIQERIFLLPDYHLCSLLHARHCLLGQLLVGPECHSCQVCIFGNFKNPICKFDIKWMCFWQYWMYFCQSVDVKMPVMYVFMAVILCMTVLLAEVYTIWQIYIQMYFCRL